MAFPERRDIEFKAFDGLTLRGWFYPAVSKLEKSPAIIIAHGWSCIKEMQLDLVAARFQENGIASLVYDHRNTGASDGLPRNEINGNQQAEDYHEAVTLLTALPEVDTSKIIAWGYSLAGGHAFQAAAIDRRIKAVVTVAPHLTPIKGVRAMSKSVRSKLDAMIFADRAARIKGEEIAYAPVVSEDPSIPAFMPMPEAAEWALGLQKTKAPNWENRYTVQSLFYIRTHNPAGFIDALSPTPWLMVQGDDDRLCTPENNLDVYHQAKEPKELAIYVGNHFSPFTGEVFEEIMTIQIEFLKRRLRF